LGIDAALRARVAPTQISAVSLSKEKAHVSHN